MPVPSSSFTHKVNAPGLLRVLQSSCQVAVAFVPTQLPPAGKEYSAIWDTGATNSVISQKVIDEGGLKQTGVAQVSGVNSDSIEPTYLVSIRLVNGVGFSEVQVTRGKLSHGSDVLIGMDIITIGDFVITNKGGETWWSFCCPSMRRTDYVAEHVAGARQNQDHGHGPRPRRHR
jgi:hypothetical protein